MRTRALPVAAAAIAAAVIAAVAAAAPAATHATKATVIASGLDSPRGLTFTPQGDLLVAEAGHGGDACTTTPVGKTCMGTTSQIAKVDMTSGTVTPVVTGLFSSQTPDGITGIDGISAGGGKLVGAITAAEQMVAGTPCDGQPADCASVVAAAKAQAGQVISFTIGGTWKALGGVGAADFARTIADPTLSSEGPNANPYGVLAVKSGVYVADSGANLVDFVPTNGAIQVASQIAKSAPGGFPSDGVPTCVALMRGNLYVADLGGRLWERGGSYTPTQVPVTGADGTSLIHHVTGCVSDGKDHLYLVDMWGTPGPPIPAGPGSAAGTGSVVELTRGGGAKVVATGLDFPNGIALAKDGSLYVSVDSICTATGTPLPFCSKGGQIVHIPAS